MSQFFGKYHLLKRIAVGNLAEVWLARQNGSNGFSKNLVLKRIHPHLDEFMDFDKEFREEALISVNFNHPNIAQTYEVGEVNGTYYIAMEYIHGEDLGRVMRKAKSTGQWIAQPLAIRIIANVCEGLYYAHTRLDTSGRPLEVVHRALSPTSIFLSFDGSVKLVDFGVALAKSRTPPTRLAIRKDEYAYVTPERVSQTLEDHRSDIFSAGMVLYELLTGLRPFERETAQTTLYAARECRIQPPSEVADVPKEFDSVVMTALAKRPNDRYRDARQFQVALEETLIAQRWVASSVQLCELMKTLFSDRLAEEKKSGYLKTSDEDSADRGHLKQQFPSDEEIMEPTPPKKASRSDEEITESVPPTSTSRSDEEITDPVPPKSVSRSKGPRPTALFTWLHLSDIHFGYSDASHQWDQLLVLEALRRDISLLLTRDVPAPEAILVTGDIAFSGIASQYVKAKAWLKKVAGPLGLDPRQVFTVPGNHDVDRAVDKNRSVGRLVRALRDSSETLDEVLAHEEDRAHLAQRMANYLEFASEFAPACLHNSVPPRSRLSWIHRMKTRSGTNVRLVGLNTALLAADDSDRGKLKLGKQVLAQAFTRPAVDPGEISLVLSHHPLRGGWLADEREAEGWLRQYGTVLLSGHVHESSTEEARSGSGSSLVHVVAGAVHEKSQPGVPAGHGYNLASIMRSEEGSLWLRIWPRLWSEKNKDFRLDIHNVPVDREYAEHSLTRAARRSFT